MAEAINEGKALRNSGSDDAAVEASAEEVFEAASEEVAEEA
jgi:hypothetical protein